MSNIFKQLLQQEDLNFLLTNRVPRIMLTRFIGWFSKIELPWLASASIAVWRMFSDLDLSDAKQQKFKSLHACFTRELKADARPVNHDPNIFTSPCDAIVGAMGRVQDGELIQAKGFPYTLSDLLHDPELIATHQNGQFITLRLTSSMYHRFHAPYDCHVQRVTYISGDTWNVNPIALKRVEKLFCKNERAVIQTRLSPNQQAVTLVPVAAILVASIKLHCLQALLHLKYRGPNLMFCNQHYRKGEEMGWFQHGSTIIVFAPAEFNFAENITTGAQIRMGQALMQLAPDA